MSDVDVRGARLAVSSVGDGPIDVLWAHGLTGSRAQDDDIGLFPWDLSPLARVVRYDVRGHGESSGSSEPADYHWPALTKDGLALADAIGLESFVAAGSSLGAAIAVHLALAAPERVRALVLVVPPAAWSDRRAQADTYERMAAIIDRKGVDGFADLARGRPPYPFLAADMPDLPEVVGRHVRRWDARWTAAALRGAAASDLPAPEALAGLAVPALVLAWRGDPTHPAGSATGLAAALPDCEFHVADDVPAVRGWRDRVYAFLARLS